MKTASRFLTAADARASIGKQKPGPKPKKQANPRIDKAAYLEYRSERGWSNSCDSGAPKPGTILHHCIIGRLKGVKELDDFRNYALVNAEDDSVRKFDNHYWRMYFWRLNVQRYGHTEMIRWLQSLPPMMRKRIDWL